MDDSQEEYYGTYLKVKQFATTNAGDLAVNPNIALRKTKVDNLINAIYLQDIIANSDDTGFTNMKENAAEALREHTKKISRGLTSYFEEINHAGNLEKVKMTNTEIDYRDDAKLNMHAGAVYLVGNKPAVKTDPLLANSQLVPADIDDLETARVAFLEMVSVPDEKRADRKAANQEKAKLFEGGNKDLLPGFDNLMAPFESSNPVLFSKYQSARAIDNLGGGSGTNGFEISNYTIPAGGSILIPVTPPIEPEKLLYFRIVTTGGGVRICTTGAVPTPCVAGYELNFGTTFKNPASDLGVDLSLPNVQITNPGLTEVIVRAGHKVD